MKQAMSHKNYWIQQISIKKGSLSRQIGIPIEENIPISLLSLIKSAPIGTTIHNPYKGKLFIKVTHLLKKRAVLALTLKRLK